MSEDDTMVEQRSKKEWCAFLWHNFHPNHVVVEGEVVYSSKGALSFWVYKGDKRKGPYAFIKQDGTFLYCRGLSDVDVLNLDFISGIGMSVGPSFDSITFGSDPFIVVQEEGRPLVETLDEVLTEDDIEETVTSLRMLRQKEWNRRKWMAWDLIKVAWGKGKSRGSSSSGSKLIRTSFSMVDAFHAIAEEQFLKVCEEGGPEKETDEMDEGDCVFEQRDVL